MRLTDVRIRIADLAGSKLKAVASITIDECFVVHDIKVIEGNEGYFIAMPSRRASDGDHKDIAHPINSETRQLIKDAILDAYEKKKQERLTEQKETDKQQVE